MVQIKSKILMDLANSMLFQYLGQALFTPFSLLVVKPLALFIFFACVICLIYIFFSLFILLYLYVLAQLTVQ